MLTTYLFHRLIAVTKSRVKFWLLLTNLRRYVKLGFAGIQSIDSFSMISNLSVPKICQKRQVCINYLFLFVRLQQGHWESCWKLFQILRFVLTSYTIFSTCPSGKNGGSLGSFGPGQMVREFDDAIFKSGSVGEVKIFVRNFEIFGPWNFWTGFGMCEDTVRISSDLHRELELNT